MRTNTATDIDLNLDQHVDQALREDGVDNDLTTRALPDPTALVDAEVIAKETGIIAGLEPFRRSFERIDRVAEPTSSQPVEVDLKTRDGNRIEAGERMASVHGPADRVLTAERVGLNYLQQLSGVATETNAMVQVADDYGVKIYDTRKTIPHNRELQKFAVRCGGGHNHRHTLSEAVMVKDNHKTLSGGLINYLRELRTTKPVIVEIHERQELRALLQASEQNPEHFDIDIIMLDNFAPASVSEVIEESPRSLTFEVSGGVRLSNLELYCKTGTDRISVGALTHSFQSLDLSLQFLP